MQPTEPAKKKRKEEKFSTSLMSQRGNYFFTHIPSKHTDTNNTARQLTDMQMLRAGRVGARLPKRSPTNGAIHKKVLMSNDSDLYEYIPMNL